MIDVNIAIVGGTLGETHKLSQVAVTGQTVLNFTLLAEEQRINRDTGQPRMVKVWHRITAYDDEAHKVAKLPKRTALLVEGRFQHNRRTDKGVAQHSVDIIADKVMIAALPSKAA